MCLLPSKLSPAQWTPEKVKRRDQKSKYPIGLMILNQIQNRRQNATQREIQMMCGQYAIINYQNTMEFSISPPLHLSYFTYPPQTLLYYQFPTQIHRLSYPYTPITQALTFYLPSYEAPLKQACSPTGPTEEQPVSPSSSSYDSNFTGRRQAGGRSEVPVTAKYAKKNAQSNVINQIFSFVSLKHKSQPVITRLLKGDTQLVALYYQALRQLKRRNKKYINRCYIKSLLEMADDHPLYALLKKLDPEGRLGVELMRRLLRVVVSYFLRNVCVAAMLTSSKLDPQIKREHLQRRSDVELYLNYHIRNGLE